MIAGNIAGKTRTLPLAVYSAVAAGDMDTAYKYVMIILLVSFLVVVLMNYFNSERENIRKAGKESMSLQVDIKKRGRDSPCRSALRQEKDFWESWEPPAAARA